MGVSLVRSIANSYSELTIATLGPHSALDVCEGAKKEGLKTLVVCQKGREKTYQHYYAVRKRSDATVGCIRSGNCSG